MDSNDHLKWIIGDMAFQIAVLQGQVESLQAELNKAKAETKAEPEKVE